MRKVRPDGTVYYYYKYKRKIGRPKKRGPKPKPKKKGPKHPMLWDWKVVQSVGKKQEQLRNSLATSMIWKRWAY